MSDATTDATRAPAVADGRGRIVLPVLLGVALVITFATATLTEHHTAAWANGFDTVAGIGAIVSGLLLAGWFIQAFVSGALVGTREAQVALRHMFAFTYAFTFLALAVLLLPFFGQAGSGAMPDRGPIRLVRGCVVAPADATPSASPPSIPVGLPRCSPDADAEVHALLLTIGGVVGTVVRGPEPAAAQRVAASASASASTSERTGTAPGAARRAAEDMGAADARAPTGGPASGASQASAVAEALPSASRSAAPATAQPPWRRHQPIAFHVQSGFVVPLFVAVLALFGGAINLMRRLPELQKRSHEDFGGTGREAPLQPCEARELVVFQILQLISAPFIATVAFYAIDPQSLPAAVALSFLSGFWSEGILLRIRAVVEGPDRVQMEAHRPAGAVTTLGAAAVLRVVVRRGGTPVGGATVSVRRYADEAQALHESPTDAQGVALLTALPAGTLQVRAEMGTAQSGFVPARLRAGEQRELTLELPPA